MIKWTEEQLEALRELDLPFDPTLEMTDEQLEQLYEEVPEHFDWHPKTGEPVGDCMLYEDILDELIKEMKPRGLLM